MTLLPYSEQQLAESRRYEDELHIQAITPVVVNTPEGARHQLDNILELYSTEIYGYRETIGALGHLVMQVLKRWEEPNATKDPGNVIELANEVLRTTGIPDRCERLVCDKPLLVRTIREAEEDAETKHCRLDAELHGLAEDTYDDVG